MSKKLIHAIFDDEEILLSSVKELRSKNIEIEEVYKLRCIEHDNDKPLFTPTYT